MSALEIVVVHRIELGDGVIDAVAKAVAAFLYRGVSQHSADSAADDNIEAMSDVVAEALARETDVLRSVADTVTAREVPPASPPQVLPVVQAPCHAESAAHLPPAAPRAKPKPFIAPVEEPLKRWTTDRKVLLAKLWPTDMHVEDIRLKLNELPGPLIASVDYISPQAAYLRVKRPSGFVGTIATRRVLLDTARADEARAAAAVTAPPVVDWPAALQWATENGLKLSADGAPSSRAQAINALRVRLQLPAWRIVQPRGVVESLPRSDVGANYAAHQ